MYRYTYKVFWHEPDESFVAIIPDISEFAGLSAFGDTPEAALADMKVVLELVEESYREEGKEMPAPRLLAKAG